MGTVNTSGEETLDRACRCERTGEVGTQRGGFSESLWSQESVALGESLDVWNGKEEGDKDDSGFQKDRLDEG